MGAPLNQPVTDDAYMFLNEKSALPHAQPLLPPFACTTTATTSSAWAR
jgi:electron-transferring-flavoprotein dehydrogenase